MSPISSSSRKRSDKKEELIKKGWEQKRQPWYNVDLKIKSAGYWAIG